MKGIILAGGRGTRLYPITLGVCKQLLPVYDKPMIYYPLAVLMTAGIREILLISAPEDESRFQALLGDGSQLGLQISYCVQPQPEGIAQALVLGEEFLAGESVCLILGDNIFYGHNLSELLAPCQFLQKGAMIFGYEVKDPERYGVVEWDGDGRVISLEEKPKAPRSRCAITGLYFYDGNAPAMARQLLPSARQEYEITDLNRLYLERGELQVILLKRGFAWLDTGTHEALAQASSYVQAIQARQGIQIACIEEIAYRMGWITLERLTALAQQLGSSDYGQYLLALCKTERNNSAP